LCELYGNKISPAAMPDKTASWYEKNGINAGHFFKKTLYF